MSRARQLRQVTEEYRDAIAAGVVSEKLILPGNLMGRQRIVRISQERIRHIASRHPDWLIFCLTHMGTVLGDPHWLGHRPGTDPRRVEFVRTAGGAGQLLLVAVKFLDTKQEAWVNTAYRIRPDYLTRRMRANTMRKAGRES
jgi:hypothetical protein